MRRPFNRWRSRARALGESWRVQRDQWGVERDIERVAGSGEPLLLGPWTGEVGYEVLYWLPFLRWLVAAYRVDAQQVVAVSRGGAAPWYAGIAGAYVDVFDLVAPDAFARRSRALASQTGTSKQQAMSPLDDELVAAAAARLGYRPRVVHPSLMFRLFRAFWSGHASMSFLERHTRYARVVAPAVPTTGLPREYVAVKFYTARSLPADPPTRAAVRSMVMGVAARTPVVLLDPGVRVDEHEDFDLADIPNTTSAQPLMTPATNLAVQTALIAGARAFVGTCGSVAWLAPMLGIDTVAVLADAAFLHAHLHVGRRAFHRMPGAGAFSPCDLGAVTRLGLTVGS